MKKRLSTCAILLFFIILNSNSAAEFRIIDKESGLAWGEFAIAVKDADSQAKLMVLKIDPRYYDLALLSRSEMEVPLLSAREWCLRFNYDICFNAGMYAADSISTIGYCRNFDHVIYPRLNRHKTMLAFNPRCDSIPPARIINRVCEDFDLYKNLYSTFLQSIRMLDCDGMGTWKESNKRHSILAIAEDSLTRIYILFSQYPLSVPDFIEQVKRLLPELKNMMYLEGGMAACLYINLPELQKDICGTTGEIWPPLLISTQNVKFPNVIAVRKKR